MQKEIKSHETYYVSCKKYIENENSSDGKTKRNRLMLLSKCTVCSKRKLTFIKNKKLYNVD